MDGGSAVALRAVIVSIWGVGAGTGGVRAATRGAAAASVTSQSHGAGGERAGGDPPPHALCAAAGPAVTQSRAEREWCSVHGSTAGAACTTRAPMPWLQTALRRPVAPPAPGQSPLRLGAAPGIGAAASRGQLCSGAGGAPRRRGALCSNSTAAAPGTRCRRCCQAQAGSDQVPAMLQQAQRYLKRRRSLQRTRSAHSRHSAPWASACRGRPGPGWSRKSP